MPTIKKILVPTDFSENSYVILPMVKQVAAKFGAQVDLIHIIPDSPYFTVARKALSGLFGADEKNQTPAKLKSHLTKKLKSTINYHIPEENRGQTFIYEGGRPETEIVKHTKTEQYDLIMVASRGMGNSLFSRGSITEGLIQFSDIPILSSNKNLDDEIATIVFPTDGSALSLEALPIALKFAEKYNASIQLLGVIVIDRTDARLVGKEERIQDYAKRRFTKDIFNNLNEFMKKHEGHFSFEVAPSETNPTFKIKLKNEKIINLSLNFKEGVSAYSSIVTYALKNGQLVAMTTHGKTGLAHFFIGSTAEKVARNLEMPVLTMKPENLK